VRRRGREAHHLNPLRLEYFAASCANVTWGLPSTFLWGQLHAVFEYDSLEMRQMQEVQRALAKAGIRPNLVLLNGRPLSLQRARFNGNFFKIQRTLQTFGQLCRREQITTLQEVDVLEILSHYLLGMRSFDVAVLDENVVGPGLIHTTLSSRPSSSARSGRSNGTQLTQEGCRVLYPVLAEPDGDRRLLGIRPRTASDASSYCGEPAAAEEIAADIPPESVADGAYRRWPPV
jgi:hypothetical protein